MSLLGVVNHFIKNGVVCTVKDLVVTNSETKKIKKEFVRKEKQEIIRNSGEVCDHIPETYHYKRGIMIGYVCKICGKAIKTN